MPERTPVMERRIAGMPVRHLVVATLVALIAALAAGAIAALTLDEDDADTAAATEDTVLRLDDSEDFELVAPDAVVGRPIAAPYVTFDGTSANTADHLGSPLVINFFAEWCAPCVAEMPDFETVHQERGADIAFLGLSTDDDPNDALALIESTGITYDVGRDTDGAMFASFDATAMPTTVFVDGAGTVLEVHSGALTADELRQRLDEHFG